MESVNLKMNCYQWRHTKNGYVKIRRETFVLHDVKFAQTPSTPGGCYSLDSHVKSVMHKNNTETVWCQSTAYVDTLRWFLTKLPSRKAFYDVSRDKDELLPMAAYLKLVNRLEFMFTFTMSPENGKCKFKDELLSDVRALATSLKLVNRLEFMFTFTMSPENGKCKFKDELLPMAAYKEWVCQDPKGDICSARCQICANSINTRRLLQPGQSC